MKEGIWKPARTFLLSLLWGIGLLLPLLNLTGLGSQWLPACAILAGSSLLFSLSALKKHLPLILSGVLFLALLIFLFPLGGLTSVIQTVNALVLFFSGQPLALPLYTREAALLLSAVISLAAVIFVRGAAAIPGTALTLLFLFGLWLSGAEQQLLFLLPALIASLCCLVLFHHRELSLIQILPLITLLALLAFLLGGRGIVSEPLQEETAQLRQKILDYTMYTEPRNIFSLSAEGYYPQGSGQLGGAAAPSDHPVMEVSTPRTVYLRGVIKNEYNGHTWLDTTAGRRCLWQMPRWEELRSAIFDQALPGGRLGENNQLIAEQTIEIRLLAPNASTLFVPQRLRELNPGGDLVPYFNNASEVFVTRDLQAGDTYRITAPLPTAGDAGLGTLLEACAAMPDERYSDILQTYTRLPNHLESQVYDLAREITRQGGSDYDRAFAIQSYLTRNYRYTLNADVQPANVDFVTNFLFNTREGYCTYFASAMTVLCRMAGLPARYVEGYVAHPDENGIAEVTGLDAHAWTEIYFSGFGWLTFDATPASAQGNRSNSPDNEPDHQDPPPDEPEPTPTPTPEPPEGQDGQDSTDNEPDPTPSAPPPEQDPTPSPTAPDQPPEDPNQEPPEKPPLTWLWLLLLLLLIALLVWHYRRTRPETMTRGLEDPERLMSLWILACCDAFDVMKLGRRKDESPLAWMKRLDQSHRFAFDLTPFGECMALYAYSGQSPLPDEIAEARRICLLLEKELSLSQKALLILRRMFVPLKKRLAQR